MLKLLAWNDRRYASAKDAQDLALLVRFYGEYAKGRLFDSEQSLMERYGFDLELAGAELLGADIDAIAAELTTTQLIGIMCGQNEDETLNEHLVREVARYIPGRDYVSAENMLSCVFSGIKLYRKKNELCW